MNHLSLNIRPDCIAEVAQRREAIWTKGNIANDAAWLTLINKRMAQSMNGTMLDITMLQDFCNGKPVNGTVFHLFCQHLELNSEEVQEEQPDTYTQESENNTGYMLGAFDQVNIDQQKGDSSAQAQESDGDASQRPPKSSRPKQVKQSVKTNTGFMFGGGSQVNIKQ